MLDAYPLWTVPPDRRVEVPHHSARVAPWHAQIDTIVLHYTADPPTTATPPRAIRWWLHKDCVGRARASAHYVIERDGAVWQCVPLDRAAWHVATTGWNGRSVGIEIANAGPPEEYPAAQIAAVASLINEIRGGLHPRGGWRLVGHSDVQGNKSDPGPLFPWGSMPLPRSS